MQPVLLQMQLLDHPRGVAQRVEGTESIGDEIRMQLPITANGASNFGLRLEKQSVPTGISQSIGSYQTIGTSSDDHRIDFTGQRHDAFLSEHGPSAGDRHASAGHVAAVVRGEQHVHRR
jgi:hypothetical protein